MFKLVSVNRPENVFIFVGGKKYTVGRKAADLTFADDASVSRHHANVEVDHPFANLGDPSFIPTLDVTDVGSKFGTFVGREGAELRLASLRETESLVGGDRVRFGRQWNEFRVEYTPLVVTSSTLSPSDTEEVKEIVWKLGGHFTRDWHPACNFVVMNSVTLTTKAVSALLKGIHIVTPDYFRRVFAAAECGSVDVTFDPAEFEPPCVEAAIPPASVKLQPNPARSCLFKGKVFIAANNKQRKKIDSAILAGGGKCLILSECSPELLRSPDTLFLQPPPEVKGNDLTQAIRIYKNQKKRFIQEPEISLAAIYSSTVTHCNPLANPGERIFTPLNTQTQTQSAPSNAPVFAPEAQSPLRKSSVDPHARNEVEESLNITANTDGGTLTGLNFAEPEHDVKPNTILFKDARPGPSKRTEGPPASSDVPSAKRRCEGTAKSEEMPKKQTSSHNDMLESLFHSDSDDEDFRTMDMPAGSPEDKQVQPTTTAPPKDGKVSKKPDGNPFVDFIPGSDSEDDDDSDGLRGLRLNGTQSNGKKRKMEDEDISVLPTAKLPTLSMNQLPTLPVDEPDLSRVPTKKDTDNSQKRGTRQTNLSQWLAPGAAKRKQASEDEDSCRGESSKKIRTEQKEAKEIPKVRTERKEAEDMPKKMQELNIKKDSADDDDDVKGISPAPVRVVSLVRRPPDNANDTSIQASRTGAPNFKAFRKVQPLATNNGHTPSRRLQRSFIKVAPNNITDEALESFENSHSQEPAGSSGAAAFDFVAPKAPKERGKNTGAPSTSSSSASSSSSFRNTHESIVVDVEPPDMDDAASTTSDRSHTSDCSGVTGYDPSDGLFDF